LEFDVVCVGGVAVDRVYRLSHLPRPGSGAHIREFTRVGGGVEANVAAALARLGARVGLVSRVGQDTDGDWARDDLSAFGVDIQRVVPIPDVRTDFCLIWVGADGERMLACDNPALKSMRMETADWDYIAQAHILFLSGFVPLPLATEVISRGRKLDLKVAFDLPDSFEDLIARGFSREAFWRLAPDMTLLVTNNLGVTSLLQIQDPKDAFFSFCQRAPGMSVAMTMGPAGAWLSHKGEQVFIEAFPIHAVDTTGAGDAFHAGLIYSLVQEGWPLRRAGVFASGLAALNCTALGARGGLADQEAVMAFITTANR
jgi:sulfofructose kinase